MSPSRSVSALDHPAVTRLDDKVDRWFERRLRGRALPDRLFYGLSQLGDWSLIWHVANVATARPGRRRADTMSMGLGLGVESALVNGVIKSLVRRERPEALAASPHHLRTPATSSFPSGHASAAAFAATVLIDRDRRRADRPPGPGVGRRAAWWTLAALVGLSRVHVRIHHASDVGAGFAVGRLLGVALRRTINR